MTSGLYGIKTDVIRRIGGLENMAHNSPPHCSVIRRIGGLENGYTGDGSKKTVIRRIGGLEIKVETLS